MGDAAHPFRISAHQRKQCSSFYLHLFLFCYYKIALWERRQLNLPLFPGLASWHNSGQWDRVDVAGFLERLLLSWLKGEKTRCSFEPRCAGWVHLNPLGNKSTRGTDRVTAMTLSHCPSLEPPPSERLIMWENDWVFCYIQLILAICFSHWASEPPCVWRIPWAISLDEGKDFLQPSWTWKCQTPTFETSLSVGTQACSLGASD